MRLLLVEDDLSIQRFLKRALLEAGYQVDTASNAKAAEAAALEGVHDALIIDLGLPDMDGLDLIARCRAQGSSAPVLIVSARRSVDERVRGLERAGTTTSLSHSPYRNSWPDSEIFCAGPRFHRMNPCVCRLTT